MLVAQAPGVVEIDERRPFAARSGRELARWMVRAGFRDDDHFRSLTYMTSITKCFPGKGASGSGDRGPSAVEVSHCIPWLAIQLELQQPRLIILAGTLAIDEFLPGQSLDAVVGRLVPATKTTPSLLPLPHPSGASRWLNDRGHRAMLERALLLLRRTWPKLR
jgi:uracil-DNA glycosylase